MRVLLVDDSKTIRNIEKSVLASLGHTEILEATNGQDALSRLWAFEPELILLELNMAGMDGLSFVRQFRAKNKQTPVIMVTTETEKARVLEAIEAGVNNFVVKPFTPDVLSQRIDETLSRRASTG